MERVRRSRELARKLWEFMTDYLIYKDSDGLQRHQVQCEECGETHEYYPAQWIGPLSDNKWVPVDGISKHANAQSIADLLRGHWSPDRLNSDIGRFLNAIRVERFGLILALKVNDVYEREKQEQYLTEILASGNTPQVNQFAKDLKSDDDLPSVLDKRRRFRTKVRQNQDVGKLVEDLVRETLDKYEDFEVTCTGIADFRMEYDDAARDDAATLKLTCGDRTWLVEVKVTRHRAVYMTVPQAKEAVREAAGFLLCVVPIGDEVPSRSTVGTTMRFVSDIGGRLGDAISDDFEGFRRQINNGIKLVVKPRSARVQIDNAIWREGGSL